MNYDEQILTIVRRLAMARRLLFITGAGVSADSGLPTYRGIGGLYHDRLTDDGIPVEMALSGQMLEQRPEITWKYLLEIARNCQNAAPNRAHQIIAELESRHQVVVLTQNIDGFHHAAGSSKIIDIHNGMRRIFCMNCGREQRLELEHITTLPPRCCCGGVLRPDVVLFGERLPPPKLELLETELDKGFDVVFSVGTTSVFPYISRPVILLGRRGALSVEINPGLSEVSELVDIRLVEKAAKALGDIQIALTDLHD